MNAEALKKLTKDDLPVTEALQNGMRCFTEGDCNFHPTEGQQEEVFAVMRDLAMENPDGSPLLSAYGTVMGCFLEHLLAFKADRPKTFERLTLFALGRDYPAAIRKALDHLGYLQEDIPAREVELCAHVDKAIEALNAVMPQASPAATAE